MSPVRRASVIVSSWVLVVIPSDKEESSGEPVPSWFDAGLRDALAEALQLCRASLQVVKSSSTDAEAGAGPELAAPRHRQRTSLLREIQQLMRRSERHLRMRRIRATYEVRVFREMRANGSEVARRIDGLQSSGRFAELARLLARAAARGGLQAPVLGDVGFASCWLLDRPAPTRGELEGCAEEGELHDARRAHQYLVLVAIALVALTVCAGSAVFTIKHPSMVPSRMNPLTRSMQERS